MSYVRKISPYSTDQGNEGTCWAHSTARLISRLIKSFGLEPRDNYPDEFYDTVVFEEGEILEEYYDTINCSSQHTIFHCIIHAQDIHKRKGKPFSMHKSLNKVINWESENLSAMLFHFIFNSIKNKYQDVYGPLSTAGLADTYTKDSPIDDMYNIVKVRDVASRRAYAREPFILRGIQRNDNSDPQRFGPTITADIPRGGLITNINRMALDVARISKFMITPKGLLFNIKQVGQQLMNPNVEGVNGKPGKIFNPNSTKLYTPINLMANIAGADKGLRFRRHGILPIGSAPGMPGKYEDVFKQRGSLNPNKKITNNRLVRLGEELGILDEIKRQIEAVDSSQKEPSKIESLMNKAKAGVDKLRSKLGFKGQVINTLTGITGPASIGGIGRTTITRAVNSEQEQNTFKGNQLSNYKPPISDSANESTTKLKGCLLYTSPSPRDRQKSRMPSSA